MSWTSEGAWDCEICDQVVERSGPWCDLYVEERFQLCRPRVLEALRRALDKGDRLSAKVLADTMDRYWPLGGKTNER